MVHGPHLDTPSRDPRVFAERRKYLGIEAEHARALLEPPAPGDDRAEVWLFRIESIGAANGEATG